MRGNRGDGTHHTKRPVHDIRIATTRGRTPIAKNIRVVDDAGKPLESTYPKRALGLVKHGRARFIDDTTIELLRPPATRAEETTMHTETQDLTTTATEPVGTSRQPQRPEFAPAPEVTPGEILSRIDMLIGETRYLREGIEALAQIASGGTGDPHSPGDIGAQAKARAIASVVEQREQTNQKLIALLDRMYGDLSPATVTKKAARAPEETKLIERLIDQAPEMSEDVLRTFLDKLA